MIVEQRLQEMASRIREMREIIGYSEEQMAEKTEVTIEEYKAVESGKVDPTFNFLHQCAITFGVDINALLEGHSAHLSGYEVTRAGQGPLTAHESHMDIRNQAAMFQNRLGTPYWVTYKYDPELLDKPIATTTHAGQEFDIVLKGSMKVRVGDHVEELNEGDSIYYRSSTPHGMLATDPKGVTFLAMVMAGEDGDSYLGLETVRPKGEKIPLVADRYIDVEENGSGHLEHISFKNTEKFNFAFDIIDAIAAKYPDKLAMLHVSDHLTERRFTFREISEISNQMANYFRSIGISKGDKVMLILKRHWQYWPAVLALHKVGAVAIPAVSQLLVHDLTYRFKAAHVKALICTADGDVALQAEKAVEELVKADSSFSMERLIVNGEREGWRSFDKEYVGFFSSLRAALRAIPRWLFTVTFMLSGIMSRPNIGIRSIATVFILRFPRQAGRRRAGASFTGSGCARARFSCMIFRASMPSRFCRCSRNTRLPRFALRPPCTAC